MTADPALRVREVGEKSVIMVCPACDGTYQPPVEVCPEDGTGLLEVPDAPLLTGKKLDQRYEIGSIIGSGAMGTVYRAFQPSMDRPVAIKVLHPKFTHEPKAVKRFFREAQAASRLIHPNIVSVFDFGRCPEGNLYMVMELVDGWTLGDLIYYRAPLNPALAVFIAMQICDGLAHAHQHRTVHRDLKPDNVQLTRLDGRVWAKVLDFGIARMMRDTKSAIHNQYSTIEIAGTPAYMSPEQILGKEPDPRTDLYAMGIILFEMLSGCRPFDDENSVTLCMKQLNDAPPTVAELVGADKLPPGLSELVASLLDKDVRRRPVSAVALKHALLAFGGGQSNAQLAHLLDPEMRANMKQAETRQDGGAAMARDAQNAVASPVEIEPPITPENPAQAEPGHRLSDIIDRVKLAAPNPFETQQARSCPGCGQRSLDVEDYCTKCGAALNAPGPGVDAEAALKDKSAHAKAKPRSVKGEPRVFAHLLGAGPHVLKSPQLNSWLEALESKHLTLRRQKLAIGIALTTGSEDARSHAKTLVRALSDLQGKARAHQLGLKIGVAIREGAEVNHALEKARRLAGIAPLGSVVIATEDQGRLGLRARPMPDALLPDGERLRAAVVSTDQTHTESGVLFGRDNVLRRLGHLQADVAREGLRCAFLEGERGLGKTAVARALMRDHRHLYVRAGAIARAWPGHTIAQIARFALGCGDGRDATSVLEQCKELPHRQRRLLAALILDRYDEGWATCEDMASVVVDLVVRFAEDRPLVLVIDDAHLMDPASLALLEVITKLASQHRWLVLGTGRTIPERSVFDAPSATLVSLRPLGLRASMHFLEAHGAPRSQLNQLVEFGEGNPLALNLVVEALRSNTVPTTPVLRTLLPKKLAALTPSQAEFAWLQAILGESASSGTAVSAAAMYIDMAFSPKLKSWIENRLEVQGGVYASFPYGWSARTYEQTLARARRLERLGLWRMAATTYEKASTFKCTDGAEEHLRVALMAARSGALDAVEPAYRAAMAARSVKSHRVPRIALAEALLGSGEHVLAERILTSTRQFVDREPYETGRAVALLARCALRRNDLEGARDRLEQARELVAKLRHEDAMRSRTLEALSQQVHAEVGIASGDLASARTNLRQASEAFRQTNRPEEAIRTLLALCGVEHDAGEHRRAADTARACVALARAAGLTKELSLAEARQAAAMLHLGQREEGCQMLRRLLREGNRESLSEVMLALADASTMIGMRQDAMRYAESAGAHARSERHRGLVLAAYAAALDGKFQAVRYLNEALVILKACGEGILVTRLEAWLGSMAVPSGESAERATEHVAQPTA